MNEPNTPTPGPWTLRVDTTSTGRPVYIAVLGAEGRTVVHSIRPRNTAEAHEALANAHLIRTACELRDALKLGLAYVSQYDTPEHNRHQREAIGIIESALDRAEGREP